MDEVSEVSSEVAEQNMDSDIKKEKPTFEEIKERAWELSQDPLNQWKKRLETRVQEKAGGINQHLDNLSTLYGEPTPDNLLVSLQYYPRSDTQKGEPINNFVESGRLPEETADIVYWISNSTTLPNDTPSDTERLNSGATDRALACITHEAQHRSFQKEAFNELLTTSEQHPEVQAVLEKLQGVKGNHVEATNELITTYLETFGKEEMAVVPASDSGATSPVKIEVDKEKSGLVLEAVIKEDVEEWRDKRKKPGPYTDLRQSWEKTLGGLPEGYGSDATESDVTSKDSDQSYKGARIYEIARSLDTSLARRYVAAGRKMDVEFVVELYKMVDQEWDRSN